MEIEAFVDLDGCEHAPTVRLSLCGGADDPDAGAEDLTPAEARELAAALLEAAQIAESYYRQPEDASPLTSEHLAVLLRLLHRAGTPPVSVPAWVPLASLHATVEDPLLSAALTDDERTWIMARITEVRDKIAGLDWPLGPASSMATPGPGTCCPVPGRPQLGLCWATGTGSARDRVKSI